jgi:hypothetical protein
MPMMKSIAAAVGSKKPRSCPRYSTGFTFAAP